MSAAAQRALNKAITSGTFERAYFLYGDNDFLKDAAARQIIDRAVDPGVRDFNVEVRRAADVDAETMESLLGTPPMMADRRVVVLRDVGALKKPARAALDRYLANPAPDAVVVLVAGAGAADSGGIPDPHRGSHSEVDYASRQHGAGRDDHTRSRRAPAGGNRHRSPSDRVGAREADELHRGCRDRRGCRWSDRRDPPRRDDVRCPGRRRDAESGAGHRAAGSRAVPAQDQRRVDRAGADDPDARARLRSCVA